MMTSVALKDFKQAFDEYSKFIKRISLDNLLVLWFDDFYDGMLSGLAMLNDQTCWFKIISDWENGIRPRTFAVISLTESQIEEEVYWHNLFKKHVLDGENGGLKPRTEHHLFFEAYEKRTDPKYADSPVIAWYIEE